MNNICIKVLFLVTVLTGCSTDKYIESRIEKIQVTYDTAPKGCTLLEEKGIGYCASVKEVMDVDWIIGGSSPIFPHTNYKRYAAKLGANHISVHFGEKKYCYKSSFLPTLGVYQTKDVNLKYWRCGNAFKF